MGIGKNLESGSTVISNPITGYDNLENMKGSIEDGVVTTNEKNKIAQGIADSVVTAGDTAIIVANSGPSTAESFVKTGKYLGVAGGGVALWGGYNDSKDIYQDWKDEDQEVKASDTLSLLSNTAAVGATGFALSGVGAPVAVALGATSLVLGVASSMVDENLSANDALVHGLGRAMNAGSNATRRILDPEEDPPEISGSQQNQLMAISKTPSFNYTSHKKDSVAGYNLYQMLDNAEDTISNSTMNGFTVYVMGKTIQPTCMGDEAGVGGGVKSGTVGKEIRATSGAPSIMYCGYLSIRADDTCTMNNENVEGKYISLC